MRIVFFDLDGTLTNSVEGIFKSLDFALTECGYPVPDKAVLQEFLGPPIVYSLQHFCGISEPESKRIYAKFRERYSTIGKFENELYPGVPDMLRTLRDRGYYIALATAKPEVFAKEILAHFHIDQYFNHVVGADYDVNRIHKMDILKKAIADYGGPLAMDGVPIAYMIGDRSYDMEAALATGCIPLGVSYGFGTVDELMKAKAQVIAASPSEIPKLLDPFYGKEGTEGKSDLGDDRSASSTSSSQPRGRFNNFEEAGVPFGFFGSILNTLGLLSIFQTLMGSHAHAQDSQSHSDQANGEVMEQPQSNQSEEAIYQDIPLDQDEKDVDDSNYIDLEDSSSDGGFFDSFFDDSDFFGD